MAEVRGDGPGGVVRENLASYVAVERRRETIGLSFLGGGKDMRAQLGASPSSTLVMAGREYLELPQDPEVFLFLFTVFSSNAEGKSKKGYMSVQPGKKRRIFCLYEESFHDFKGRYFKVFPVGDHPPFWMTLEHDARRFSSYWSKDAGLNYTPVLYRTLNDEQRDTTDVLLWLFSKRPLKPKAVLGNPEHAREAIVKMAGRNKTLAQLRRVMQANPQGLIVLSHSGGHTSLSAPEGGSSMNVEEGIGDRVEVSSPIREEGPEVVVKVPPVSTTKKRGNDEGTSAQKRPRLSEGSQRDFCPVDRFFDAAGFIESNLLTPGAREILQDHDPLESLRWAQWIDNLRLLNQQKAEVEKGKLEVDSAKLKVEKDLEAALVKDLDGLAVLGSARFSVPASRRLAAVRSCIEIEINLLLILLLVLALSVGRMVSVGNSFFILVHHRWLLLGSPHRWRQCTECTFRGFETFVVTGGAKEEG
ncbi:hypothetical protein PIB30_014349 [Stylosanthes scabra]|uniref:Uncharacterized protein n=1 Tax=Stylosanthes scabra TaxID=79078 RepID=A0ABU6S814_9FABA|nr:hypothetical protein [Stylosanthes scabra]